KDGRTVLFVSHNMGAIQSLCTNCILLNNGSKFTEGAVAEVINKYIDYTSNENINTRAIKLIEGAIISDYGFYIDEKRVYGKAKIMMGQSLKLYLEITATQKIKDVSVAIDIWNSSKELYSHLINEDAGFIVGLMEPEQKRSIKIETS